MKLSFSHAFIAFSAGILAPVTIAQAAYSPAVVAADARWVVYADLNALRASSLGKKLVNAINTAKIDMADAKVGLDVPKLLATVGTLTAYGTNLSPDPKAVDGALVAQGTNDLRKIAESILLQCTIAQPEVFVEVNDLPFPAYAILDPKVKEGDKTQLVFAFPPEPIVLVSKSKAQLLKAREVFRGKAPSLATASASPINKLAAQASGSYLFAASVVPTEPIFPEKAPQARILQLANAGSLAVGERGTDTFAHVELVASSDRNADKLMKILEGMTSMLSLAESNDKQLAEFLNSTAVSREKDTVIVHLAYQTARLVQMTQNLRTQAEGRAEQRKSPISIGKQVAEWTAADVESGPDAEGLTWRTISNVELTNGCFVNLGRQLNGGRDARFNRLELVPAAGGAPMTFRHEFARIIRGSIMQFPFPGADGTYTLKVAYINDPEGKAKFAVSVVDPKLAAAKQPARPAPPAAPEPLK